jgi:hypothetical protein
MPTRRALLVLASWIAAAALGNAAPAPQDVATKDRLSLTLADDGSVTKLSLDAKELPLLAAGGFFLQDMSRKFVPREIPTQQCAYPGVPLRGGTVERIADGGLRQRIESAAAGVSFEAQYLPRDGHVEIQTRLKNLSADDRAFVLYFRLPVDATGWNWARALGDERVIKEGSAATSRTTSSAARVRPSRTATSAASAARTPGSRSRCGPTIRASSGSSTRSPTGSRSSSTWA